VARGLVPDEFIDRKKMGFDVPLSRWLRQSPLKEWSERLLFSSRLTRRGLLDQERVRSLLTRHQSGAIDAGFRIWNLVNLSAWYDRWIEPA
jgi:asparagine synthase (glutamine-hydrolysing)